MWSEHGAVEHAEERRQKSHVVDFPAAETVRHPRRNMSQCLLRYCVGLEQGYLEVLYQGIRLGT